MCTRVWILCLYGIRKSLIHTMCTASVIYKSGIKNSLGAHVDIILFSLFSVSCPGAWCRPGDTGVSMQSVWWGGTRKQWSDCGVCLHSLQIGISHLWQGRSENSRITLYLCSIAASLLHTFLGHYKYRTFFPFYFPNFHSLWPLMVNKIEWFWCAWYFKITIKFYLCLHSHDKVIYKRDILKKPHQQLCLGLHWAI